MANTAGVVSLFRLTPRALQVQSEAISRALDSPAASVQDMGVDHRSRTRCPCPRPIRQTSNDASDSLRFRSACQLPQKPLLRRGTGLQSGLSPVHPSLLPRVGGLHFTRRHAASSGRSPERRGPRPASGEGKLELTKAPRSHDRGRGNSRRLPLRTAEEGVPREARKREAACLRVPFFTRPPGLSPRSPLPESARPWIPVLCGPSARSDQS